MKTVGWWGGVERRIRERSLLLHPFYKAWQAGKLSMGDLRRYAVMYYPHVAHFPRYVSAVHSRTEDAYVRQMLLENLIEEEHGPENHPELWLRFAESLGVARREVLAAPPGPETKECVDTFVTLTAGPDPIEGLAALYAYESQIPDVSATKIQGLGEFYGIRDPRGTAFFRAHQEADVWHSQQERQALQKLARTQEARARAARSVERSCEAVWKLLDGVVREQRIPCVPASA